MKKFRKVVVVALALVAAACSVQGDAATPLEPAGPRFGGMGYGSGNRVGDDTTTVASSYDPEPATAAGQPALMPGMGYGSGN